MLGQLELGAAPKGAPASVEGRRPGGSDAAQDSKAGEKETDWPLSFGQERRNFSYDNSTKTESRGGREGP